MATKTMSVKILLVNKTSAEWVSESTIISKGLPCVEFTTDGRTLLKIGDGSKAFSALPYVSDGSFQISNYYTKEEVTEQINNKVDALGDVVRVKGVKATVGELPTEDNEVGDLWFVGAAGETTDNFSEYIWTTSGTWEFLGRVQTDVDLSGYVQTKDFTPVVTRVETLETNVSAHTNNDAIHVTAEKTAAWDKAVTDLGTHTADKTVHITADERTAWNNKVDKVDGKGLSTNDLTDELLADIEAAVDKLEGIEEGATAITVDNAMSATSTNPVENKAVYAAIKGVTDTNTTQQEAIEALQKDTHTHANQAVLDATTASYTTEEKTKLSNIEEGANKTVVDTALSDTSSNPVQNKAVKAAIDAINTTSGNQQEAIEALQQDTHTHTNKTVLDGTTASYTTEEKTKLSGIEDGANKTVVDTALSATSTNPVENKAVKAAIDDINEAIETLDGDSHTHANQAVLDATTASYTTAEKTKLGNIEDGANKTVVDTALSETSTNPVENKAVYAAIKGVTDTNTDLTERVEAIEEDYITSADLLTLNCTL